MSLLLSILLFVQSSYSIALNNTIVHELASYLPCVATRSIHATILSCVATLFACAWTAIHPNIPGPADGWASVFFRRLYLMGLALVAPELILMWAIHQSADSRSANEKFQEALQDGTLMLRVKPFCEPRLVAAKDEGEDNIQNLKEKTENGSKETTSLLSSFPKPSSCAHEGLGVSSVLMEQTKGRSLWTMKHSAFAWMGGFMLYVSPGAGLPHEAYQPLTPDELLDFLKKGQVEMPVVSEKDLDDRSKGDWLSKTIAILQLVWFILQLAARAVEKLPTMLLEIETFAVASLSFISYVFWLYKPKEARCAVPVYWKQPGPLLTDTLKSRKRRTLFDVLQKCGIRDSGFNHFLTDLFQEAQNLIGLATISDGDIKARRVPYFCGYRAHDVSRESGFKFIVHALPGCVPGMLFGGAHCIAWNSSFPTPTEKMLWRTASVTMIALPLLLTLVASILLRKNRPPTWRTTCMVYLVFALEDLYLLCRLAVFTLMLLSLRALPPGVDKDVCWTSFIPHW